MAIATVATSESQFNYDVLNQADRTWLRQAEIDVRLFLNQATDLSRQYSTKVIQLGGKLAEVRDRLSHNKQGGFEAWLNSNGLERSHAFRCIRAYEELGDRANFEAIDISPKAIHLLAARATPAVVRDEILARASEGEVITPSVVKTLLKDSTAGSESGGLVEPAPKPMPVMVGEMVQVRSGNLAGRSGVVRSAERDYAIVELPDDGQLVPVMYSELMEAEDELEDDAAIDLPPKKPEVKNPPPVMTLPADRVEGMEARLRVEQERMKLLSQENRELKEKANQLQVELKEEIAYGDALYEFLISVLDHLPDELQSKARTLLGANDES